MGQCLGGAIALVNLMHRQCEAPLQLAREALRSSGIVVRRAIGVIGHTHHQLVGLPLTQQGRDALESHRALGCDGRHWAGLAQQTVASGHTHSLCSEIKCHVAQRPIGHLPQCHWRTPRPVTHLAEQASGMSGILAEHVRVDAQQ